MLIFGVVVISFSIVLISPLFLSSAGKDSSTRDLPNATKSVVKEAAGGNKLKGEMSPEVVETSLAAADDNAQDKSMVQDSTTKTVEVSDERVVVRVTTLL